MYSIIELNNRQYKAEFGKPITVDRLNAEPDSLITIDRVLLFRDDKQGVKVGTPYIQGMVLKARVLNEKKGKKIRVFKYKKRKDYRRTIGSRPIYSTIILEQPEEEK